MIMGGCDEYYGMEEGCYYCKIKWMNFGFKEKFDNCIDSQEVMDCADCEDLVYGKGTTNVMQLPCTDVFNEDTRISCRDFHQRQVIRLFSERADLL